MLKPLTSIIIVNWNTKALTERCIQSIYDTIQSGFEIIMVDNGSTDGSAPYIREKYPQVHILANSSNKGYACANNQGIRAAQGDLFLLMNSDTAILSPEPLERIRTFLHDNPAAGIIGAKLLYPNGKIQSCGREFISLKTLVKEQLLFRSALPKPMHAGVTALPVDYVDGAFLAIRRNVVDKIGLLNEAYYMYAEDMEWCFAARRAGWQIVVLPDIEILHEHAASSIKRFREILVHNAVNTCRFIAKTRGLQEARSSFYVLLAGMLLRIPISLFRKRNLALDYYCGLKRCLSLLRALEPILTGKDYETGCR